MAQRETKFGEANYRGGGPAGWWAVDPKTVRREPQADDVVVRERLRDLAAERRRFGYRLFGVLLERAGVPINKKKLSRHR